MKVIDNTKIKAISGGNPIIVGLAIAGAYYTGKELGRSARKHWDNYKARNTVD